MGMSGMGITPVYDVDDAGERELSGLMETYGDVTVLDERARTCCLTYEEELARGRMHDIIDSRAVQSDDDSEDIPVVQIMVEGF